MDNYEIEHFKSFEAICRKIASSEPLTIRNTYAEKVKARGTCTILDSRIERLKAKASCTLQNTQVHDCVAEGKLTCKQGVKALTITACDVAEFDQTVCKVFRNTTGKDGVSAGIRKVKGSIHALTYENFTSSVLNYDFHYMNILNKYFLECEKPLHVQHFISFAPFYIPAISAELMFIRPYFNTNVSMLKAKRLMIANRLTDNSMLENIFSIANKRKLANKQFEASHMHVDRIEAEEVMIENCDVRVIKAKHAIIGADCVVDELIAESYELEKNAQVLKVKEEVYADESK